ncbi:MAG TPA: hypothetical protein VGQ55_03785 [Pyrinomonadaceae bacterium]|nr:hypothetical protein [Pyrinomonadaceae bacterium]
MPASRRGNAIKFKKREFPYHYVVKAYGVKIGVSTNAPDALREITQRIANILPEFEMLDRNADADQRFFYIWNPSRRDTIYKNGETLLARAPREYALDQFERDFRLTTAEFAVERVFLHAGVVSWKGKAIVMPAHSFQGKSTLTAELVQRGALYFSDEYAIIDKDGFVHPFPKKLSIRGEIDEFTQLDHPVEKFGGAAGTERAAVGLVLFSEYKPKARWDPKTLTAGEGVFELIKYALPIRRDPSFVMDVLKKIASGSLIVKTKRGEVVEAADRLIALFEEKCL